MRTLMHALVHYIAAVALLALLVRLVAVRWWATGVGRHLTAMIAAIALAFVLWSASIVWGPLPPLVWVLVLAHIAVVVTWRLVLQVRAIDR